MDCLWFNDFGTEGLDVDVAAKDGCIDGDLSFKYFSTAAGNVCQVQCCNFSSTRSIVWSSSPARMFSFAIHKIVSSAESLDRQCCDRIVFLSSDAHLDSWILAKSKNSATSVLLYDFGRIRRNLA